MVHFTDMLQAIPQASVVSEEHRDRWVAGITKWHADRAVWHVRRLHGFGGSEIGAILRHDLKLNHGGFSTAKRIIEQKLLMRLPEFENVHMRRGNVLEHLARLAFLYRYGAERDLAAIEAMARPHGKQGFEWHVGNPDDIVQIKGKRFVPDYKVPATYSETIDYDYRAQLHHYAIGARLRGIPVDGLILAKLDLAPQTADELVIKLGSASPEEIDQYARLIAKADLPGFRVVSHVVDFSRDMQLDILSIGRHYWEQHVLTGVVPDANPEPMIAVDDARLLDIARYQQEYAMVSAASSHLEALKKKVGAQLKSSLEGVSLDGTALPLSVVKASHKHTQDDEGLINEARARGATEAEISDLTTDYSIPALLAEITRLNGDTAAPSLFVQKPSVEKAADYVIAKGGSKADFITSEVSIRLSTSKEDKKAVDLLKQSAEEVYGGWMSALMPEPEDEQFIDVLETVEEFAEQVGATIEPLDELFASPQEPITKPQPRIVGMR